MHIGSKTVLIIIDIPCFGVSVIGARVRGPFFMLFSILTKFTSFRIVIVGDALAVLSDGYAFDALVNCWWPKANIYKLLKASL